MLDAVIAPAIVAANEKVALSNALGGDVAAVPLALQFDAAPRFVLFPSQL
jgi:hypothetical protein